VSGNRATPKKKAPVRRSKTQKAPLSVRQRLLKVLKWAVIVMASGFVLLTLLAVIVYQRTSIPNPNEEFQTQTTNIYYAGGKAKLGQFAQQNRESIAYSEMPECIKQAVVAAENRSFWTDKGIDPKGILRAAFSNAQSGQITGGASTITQQYVKILYLNQERTYKRKIKEAILSLKLQRQKSKQEILEGYLNTIYFGRGAYGIQAASQAFFNKSAKDLTVPQCAVLASVLNNPTRMDPDRTGDSGVNQYLLSRYRYVLSGMVDAGNLTDAEAAKASAALPKFPKQKQSSAKGGQKGFMLTMIESELNQLGFSDQEITGGGLRVTTTFTKQAMAAAQDAVKENAPTVARDGSKITDKQLHVAVASVQPGTGALVGFYGGQDFLKSELNWAEQGGMVGSTMKPFTLAAAIKQGFSLKSTWDGNSPYHFAGSSLTVHNEGEQAGEANGHSYGAHITSLTALEQSVNTAFIDMSQSMDNGPKSIYETAKAMGIPGQDAEQSSPGIPDTSKDFYPKDTLITLGKAQISPINMANAYATIAAGGKRSDVHVVTKVVDRNGVVRYQWKNNSKQAISEDVAADTSYALQQVVKSGTGRKALALGRPAAGKTGTATAPKCATCSETHVSSAWFVGYTPNLSTAVMYVRGKGREALDGWMPSYFGADYPTRTWLSTMQVALEGTDVEQFPAAAWLSGTPPTHGHEAGLATPSKAPKPSKKPKPSKTPKATKTPVTTSSAPPASLTPTPTQTITQPPETTDPAGSPTSTPTGAATP
jgi:membrane peptidoglycan carboxypeptidase